MYMYLPVHLMLVHVLLYSTCTYTQIKHVHVHMYLPVHLMLVHVLLYSTCTCTQIKHVHVHVYLPVHLMNVLLYNTCTCTQKYVHKCPSDACTCTIIQYMYTNQTCTCTRVLTCPSDACTYTTITPVCSSIVLTGLDIIDGYDPVDVFTFTLYILCTIDIYSQWCGSILCMK